MRSHLFSTIRDCFDVPPTVLIIRCKSRYDVYRYSVFPYSTYELTLLKEMVIYILNVGTKNYNSIFRESLKFRIVMHQNNNLPTNTNDVVAKVWQTRVDWRYVRVIVVVLLFVSISNVNKKTRNNAKRYFTSKRYTKSVSYIRIHTYSISLSSFIDR